MYGPPKDVEGQCNARLYVGDDFGDNHATMRCQREPKHDGKHREVFKSRLAGEVVIEWERDERMRLTDEEPLVVEDLLKPIPD